MKRVVVSALAAAAGMCQPAAAECISDWSTAAQIARSEKLLSVEKLRRGVALGGEILTTTLCQDGGQYHYKFVVRQQDGRLKTVPVNAMPPAAASAFGR